MSKIGTAFRTAVLVATASWHGCAQTPVRPTHQVDHRLRLQRPPRILFRGDRQGLLQGRRDRVKIVGGKGSVDAIHQVAAGNAIFGFADAGSLVLARANDSIPVKLVAIVYARPPQAILCRGHRAEDAKGSRRQIHRQSGRRFDPRHVPGLRQGGRHRRGQGELGSGCELPLPGLLASGKVPCVGQFTVGEPLLRRRPRRKSWCALHIPIRA